MTNKLVLGIILILGFSFSGLAQNNAGKTDDAGRVSLTPRVSDQKIPQGAKDLLITKMTQIASLNGLSGNGDNPLFIMDAKVDILSKELTTSAPPMHALNLSITFFIGDNINNNVYSEVSIEAKGVGKNETKAYIAAIENINTRQGSYKAFVERGKNKIVEFYNGDCDFVLSKARALIQQGNNRDAIAVLQSVPKLCIECYDKAMELLGTVQPPVDEPVTVVVPGDSVVAPSTGKQMEIDNGIFLVFTSAKYLGNKVMVYFNLVNETTKDYDLNDYIYDTRIIDNNGIEAKVEEMNAGGSTGSYAKVTIIPGVPVKVECQFPKVDAIEMFEYIYKGKTFRIKKLDILPEK